MEMRLALFVPMLVVAAAGCSSDTTSNPASTTTSVKSTSSVSVSTQVAPTSASDTNPATQARRQLDPTPIRATIANGCPPSVGGHPDYGSTAAEWIGNPEPTGLADSFVPGQPTRALICRYAALDAVTALEDGTKLKSGDLYSSTSLDASKASALAATLNAIVPWDFTSACVPPDDKARYTAIVFALPDRADVDVWLKDWYDCPTVDNGVRGSGELINGQGHDFLTQLNSLAPPAPPQHPAP
jgi:hypothetical protein